MQNSDNFNWLLCLHAFLSYSYCVLTIISGVFMNLLPSECQSILDADDSSTSIVSSLTNYTLSNVEYVATGLDHLIGSSNNNNSSSSSSSSSWYAQGFVSGLSQQYSLCHRASGELTSVLLFAGATVGSLSVGAFADNFGRVASMYVGILLSSLSHLLAAWAPVFWLHLTARWINGCSVMFCMTSTAVYGCEASSVQLRARFFAWFGAGGAFGLLAAPLPALLTRQHQHLQATLAMLAIPPLLLSLLLPESVRWLSATGRSLAAARSQARIDRINAGHLLLQWNGHNQQKQQQEQQQQQQEPLHEKQKEEGGEFEVTKKLSLLSSLRQLMKNQKLLLRGLAIAFYSFSIALNFYGFYFIVAKVVTNLYVYTLLLGASELPYPLVFNLASRRTVLIIAGIGAAASSLGIALIMLLFPDSADSSVVAGVNLTLGFIGSFFGTVGFNVIVIVSTETFPTSVRNCCAGACTAVLRIGCMLAPAAAFIPSLSLQLLLLSVPLLIACVTVLPLPDTRNSELSDEFKDGTVSPFCSVFGSIANFDQNCIGSGSGALHTFVVSVWSFNEADLKSRRQHFNQRPAMKKFNSESNFNANAAITLDAKADANVGANFANVDANVDANVAA